MYVQKSCHTHVQNIYVYSILYEYEEYGIYNTEYGKSKYETDSTLYMCNFTQIKNLSLTGIESVENHNLYT